MEKGAGEQGFVRAVPKAHLGLNLDGRWQSLLHGRLLLLLVHGCRSSILSHSWRPSSFTDAR